jgi:hypothetical protein
VLQNHNLACPNASGVTDMMAIHDCIGGLAPDMDIIADAVRIGFVKCHEAEPLESFREAVLAVLPDNEARAKLRELPKRGEFDVLFVPRLCAASDIQLR